MRGCPSSTRRRWPPLLLLPALLALLSGAAGCGAAAPAGGPAPDAVATLRQLRQLADGCASAAECRTVAVGRKPCGGPEMYVPWSSRAGSAADVDALAARYLAQRGAATAQPGMLSDCRLIGDPGALCKPAVAGGAGAGTCVLRRAGTRDPA